MKNRVRFDILEVDGIVCSIKDRADRRALKSRTCAKVLVLCWIHDGVDPVGVGCSVRKHGENIRRSKGPSVFTLVEDRIKVDRVHLPACFKKVIDEGLAALVARENG